MKRALLIAISLVIYLTASGATKPDGKMVVRAMNEAKEHIEYAHDYVVLMFNAVLEEHRNGKQEADSLMWFNKIVPYSIEARAEIDTVMTALDNLRRESIDNDFWKSFSNDVYYKIVYGATPKIKDVAEVYGDDYLKLLMGTDSMILVYLSMFDNCISALHESRDKIMELIDAVETDESVLWKKTKKETKQQKTKTQAPVNKGLTYTPSQKSQAISTAYRQCLDTLGTTKLYGLKGISLGKDYEMTKQELKKSGFKLIHEYTEEEIFYGICSHAFYKGDIDGEPVSIRITAPLLDSHSIVYGMEIIYLDIIDEVEATEKYNVLMIDLPADYKSFSLEEMSPSSLGSTVIETFGSKGRTYKRVAMETNFNNYIRIYEEQDLKKENSIGSISLSVKKDLSSRFVIVERIYDRRWAKFAESLRDYTK